MKELSRLTPMAPEEYEYHTTLITAVVTGKIDVRPNLNTITA